MALQKDNFFFLNFQSGHEAPTYQAFSHFQFASNDHRMVSSWSTSHIVIRESALMMALSWSLSTFDGQRKTSHFQALVPFAKLLDH